MKSTFVILFILFFNFLFLSAQVWCPTGATWVYRYDGFFSSSGIYTLTYTGDTIIKDKACKKLTALGMYYDNPIPGMYFGPNYFAGNNVYTYQNLDSIFYFEDSAWILYYLFNQPVGSVYYTNHKVFFRGSFNYQLQKEIIKDNTDFIANGTNLQSYYSNDTIMYMDTLLGLTSSCGFGKKVVERIGAIYGTNIFNIQACGGSVIDQTVYSLVCYYDATGEYYHLDSAHSACDYLYNSIQHKNINQLTTVYPNPTTNKISFNLAELNLNNDAMNQVKMVDLYGKVVLEQTIDKSSLNEIQTIDLSQLNLGTYILYIGNNQSKIIKY